MSTQNPGGKQWRFESIDIRAGIAIALWREERDAEHGLPPERAPALFFCPPHFQPEPIVNTAVALSACRGTFEPGLYVDEEGQTEASFAAPAQVSEFLRRAYVGGAAGDGGDGGEAGPVPPPPEGEDGSREPAPLYESRVVLDLTTRIQEFETAVQKVPQNSSKSFFWGESAIERQGRYIGIRAAGDGDATAFAAAALALIAEMLRRMPDMTDARAWLRWYEDVRELTCLLVELGVAELLQVQPFRDGLETVLRQSRLIKVEDMPEEQRFRLFWLMLFGPTMRGISSVQNLTSLLYELEDRYWYFGDRWIFPASTHVKDPLDTLSRLPLPEVLHSILPDDVRNKASVFHLLNLVVAEPQAVCRDPATTQLAVCIALFAAACIASTRTAVHHAGAAPFSFGHHDHERARRAIEQAHTWLIEHMPRTVYARSYEAIIGKTKSLRYFRRT
jgi:hypothetical protein